MVEIWKEVEGFPSYEISSWGRVINVKTSKVLTPRIHRRYNYRYASVLLYSNGAATDRIISRLVANAFIPNENNKPFVNHINNNAIYNRVENLEWVTHRENVQHALKHNRYANCGRKSFKNEVNVPVENSLV